MLVKAYNGWGHATPYEVVKIEGEAVFHSSAGTEPISRSVKI
jgi:hypothetical protein